MKYYGTVILYEIAISIERNIERRKGPNCSYRQGNGRRAKRRGRLSIVDNQPSTTDNRREMIPSGMRRPPFFRRRGARRSRDLVLERCSVSITNGGGMADIYFIFIIFSLGTRVGENHPRSMRARPAAGTACGPAEIFGQAAPRFRKPPGPILSSNKGILYG